MCENMQWCPYKLIGEVKECRLEQVIPSLQFKILDYQSL